MTEAGDVEATATTPLPLSTPRPGWAEQHPDTWWDASLASIRQLLAPPQSARRVLAVGISGQMHSSVFLDRAAEVIRPALLWCDGRTTAECAEITQRVGGEDRLREWVCNPALEGFTLPKVLWLKHHEPAAFARLATVLLAKDFVRLRLTETLGTEPSGASGTLMFDPARVRWSRDMLDAVGLPVSLVPKVGGSSEVLGHVTPAAAGLTGLVAGTPVVGGGADNACGAAGVGAITPGEAVASWGTSGTVLAPTAEPRVDPALRAHTFCHVAPGVWYVMGVVLSAGGAFAWYRDQFARDLAGADQPDMRLSEEAAAIPPGEHGEPRGGAGLRGCTPRRRRGGRVSRSRSRRATHAHSGAAGVPRRAGASGLPGVVRPLPSVLSRLPAPRKHRPTNRLSKAPQRAHDAQPLDRRSHNAERLSYAAAAASCLDYGFAAA